MSLSRARSALSFAECRRLAWVVRSAPRGGAAVAAVRPPGGFEATRSRGPLAVVFYVADREGRLVRPSAELFALLDHERGQPPAPLLAGGLRVALARVIDRHWGVLIFGVPPAGLLALAAGVGLLSVARTGSVGSAALVGVLLTLAALVWVVAFLVASVVRSVWRGVRPRGRPAGPTSFASLAWWHWSVPLVHAADPERVPELLELVLHRRDRLVSAEVAAAHRARGVVSPPGMPGVESGHRVGSPLVIATEGVTSDVALAAVHRMGLESGGSVEADCVVLLPPLRRMTPQPPTPPRGVASLYVLASALSVAVMTYLVAATEQDACAPACEGRPASLVAALRWAGQRLLFSDPPGISPGTGVGVVAGLLLSTLSAVGVLVLLVAAYHTWRVNRERVDEYVRRVEQATRRVRVLLVTVTPVEHEAVLAAARRRTGQPARPAFAGLDTAFHLGVVGDVEVVAGKCQQQGPHGPGGAALTPSRLVAQTDPHFVIMVGICYGLRPKQQAFGDVLVARHVQNIDHKKIVDVRDDGEGEGEARPVVLPRGEIVPASPLLVDRCQAGTSTWTGARVHIGLMLAAATLVNSATYGEELHRQYSDAIGGEMEGHGLAAAAIAAGVPWALVKGIADFARDKTRHYQQLAATNAAEFVLHVIASGGLAVTAGRPE